MKKLITVCAYLILFCTQSLFAQQGDEILIGNRFIINSAILEEDRNCIISLPDSYYDPKEQKNYPIMILLDGYTHFKSTASTVHFMSSDRNRNYLMPETIIVAIENIDRERDFTVTKIKTKRPNTMGGGRKFLSFIEKELVPYIDANYRTETHRILVGHSLGGLLTINSYIDENSLFDAYIAIDPSIWWDEQMMKAKVDSIKPVSLQKKLYIATANQGEANYQRNQKRHETLYGLIIEKNTEDSNIKLEYFARETHRSVPLKALYNGLIFLNDE
jgi:predicted alpha/beta superfamily hydrolase